MRSSENYDVVRLYVGNQHAYPNLLSAKCGPHMARVGVAGDSESIRVMHARLRSPSRHPPKAGKAYVFI